MNRLLRIISMTLIASLVFSVLFACSGCTKNTTPDDPGPDTLKVPSAQAWLTKGDKSVLFARQDDLPIVPPGNASWPEVLIDTTYQFQEVEGYGAALTGSSAYLFNQALNATRRQQILKELFDPQMGIGLSYLRLTMGASDFSLSDFTYNDLPAGQTDFHLEKFSLSRDLEDVVPVLQEINQIFPQIKLMGTPWSPPAWMKTNGSLKGGKLRTDCYSVYAQYFVRYIQEMQKKGLSIDAVTPQNEPLYWTAGYPCMEMQPEEQKVFIRDHLGPAFVTAGLQTKIFIYDHNWDHPEYATAVLSDPEAARFIAGTAFHAYAGDVSAMGTLHDAFPDKGLYFTEISGGEWAVNFSDNLLWYMKNILIGTARNWSKVALFWNLALDQNHGPRNNGCQDCRGVITISNGGSSIVRNEEYYALAHFSKFVRPGAQRIYSRPDQVLMNMDFVAFRNEDGTKALIVANYNDSYKTFRVRQANRSFNYSLAPKSVVTLVWK